MQELSHPARLAKPELPTLVYRRNSVDAILAYKLMMANMLPALFSTVDPNSRTRGHCLKLVKQSTLYGVFHTNSFHQETSIVRTNSLMRLLLLNLWTSLNKSWMLSGPQWSENSTGSY